MGMPSNDKVGIVTACCLTLFAGTSGAAPAARNRLATYANPVDLPYRYQAPVSIPRLQLMPGQPYREAADPALVLFKGQYWLFASHSKGYWRSTDLLHWSFVEASGYAVDKFAPTAVVMGGRMFLATSEATKRIWTTDDPMSGRWTEAATISSGYQDPDLFLDDNSRLYMYDGLAPSGPLHAYELDPKTLQPLARVDIPQSRSKETRGWEVPGDHNEKTANLSFVEGSWMTKYKGRYYLEYSAPGTESKTYANGMLVADKPMGPFTYQAYSPFAVKPTGFIAGAGHGSTFQAKDGRWWHAGTMTISRRHIFERRLGLFPTRFTAKGEILADTYLGDYPHYLDGDRGLTGWMLLSRSKAVTASSKLNEFPAENAVDEDVRTWWSAKTGGSDEWFQVDLGEPKQIEAVQINFADEGSAGIGISKDVYNYVLELSNDGRTWRSVIDRSAAGRDAPHDYEVLPKADQARFVRLRNVHSPDGGKFSLYDLRVFGRGYGAKPAKVGYAQATRDAVDGRKAAISWAPAKGADFYVVRLGVRPDLMNQNYQVYDGQTSVAVASLNLGAKYCFVVDAVNENGIARGDTVRCMP
ncbi:family 43 glycosylhydrolase [Phenylobacterium sp. LjRoot225]|uniref:family 43 glycosylhydrolase n=1 Tax=Phenylobacterium sp. LjRoot225 TaxID=3342285 RepID=UPI003ED01E72